MVTGALGKKATFATTARKSKEDDTPFYHKREVMRIQEKSPEHSKRESQKQEQFKCNARPEVISPSTNPRRHMKANRSMKKRDIWIRTHTTEPEKDAWSTWPRVGTITNYRKAKGYYQEMVDEYHRETRERPDITTEYWRLGDVWTEGRINHHHQQQIRHENRSLSQSILEARDSYPVTGPEEIKNWLKRMDGLENGYATSKCTRGNIDPTPIYCMERYPKLGNLNLQER